MIIAAVIDPVPWARAQMAFTLGAHIILVPLGVSWAFMILVANWRALARHDADARRLAENWSRFMAVTFAVGAATGTVLSFEFGLLWPAFMERFGPAFGLPFAIEGIFFFIEAIFIAIYIYGWKRLAPWTHFWTGVPIVLSGIGGTAAVVAANGWMNAPAGFTMDASGRIVDVDVWQVLFNRAMPYEAAHMLAAAYLAGGFMIASVYAVGMLRGRRDRYHRVGFLIAFSTASIAAPAQLLTGDLLARWVRNNEPAKFAAMELVPTTSSHVPEVLLGYMKADGTVSTTLAIPNAASILAEPSTGAATVIRGLDTIPASERPTTRQVNVVHTAWGVMVGIGSLLLALAGWYGLSWLVRRDMPSSPLFLWLSAAAGVLAIIALEAGWVVTEVGRQPWIVHGYMKVGEAATPNQGVWMVFFAIVAFYTAIAITLAVVLRGMSRRMRDGVEPLERTALS